MPRNAVVSVGCLWGGPGGGLVGFLWGTLEVSGGSRSWLVIDLRLEFPGRFVSPGRLGGLMPVSQ
jgi:hypothetical protein